MRVPAVVDYNHFLITRLGAGCYNVIWSDKLLNMMSKKWGKFDCNHFLRTRLGAGSGMNMMSMSSMWDLLTSKKVREF